jgi:hypothetical protein
MFEIVECKVLPYKADIRIRGPDSRREFRIHSQPEVNFVRVCNLPRLLQTIAEISCNEYWPFPSMSVSVNH